MASEKASNRICWRISSGRDSIFAGSKKLTLVLRIDFSKTSYHTFGCLENSRSCYRNERWHYLLITVSKPTTFEMLGHILHNRYKNPFYDEISSSLLGTPKKLPVPENASCCEAAS